MLLLAALLAAGGCTHLPRRDTGLTWHELPALPALAEQPFVYGLSGAFVGVSNGVLLVAGGCNFAGRPLRDGEQPVYSDEILRLDPDTEDGATWVAAGRLPAPQASGAGVTAGQALFCVGGENRLGALASVVRLEWDAGSGVVRVSEASPLPSPRRRPGGSSIDSTIYVVGGVVSGRASSDVWALDTATAAAWRRMPAFPGTGRADPLVACCRIGDRRQLVVLGGFTVEGPTGVAAAGGYRCDLELAKWESLGPWETPVAEAAGRSAAAVVVRGDNEVIIIGGRSPEHVAELSPLGYGRTPPPGKHRDTLGEALAVAPNTCPRTVAAYDMITGTWRVLGNFPGAPPAATQAVWWRNMMVIPGGEVRPGVATPRVYAADALR